MSPSPSPSPSHPSASTPHLEESQLPKGQCRYILMIPELKGQRCGCMGFDHNKSRPGATCNCGHLSCFHITAADTPTPSTNKSEIELVKHQMQVLEENFNRNDHDRFSHVIARISELEEVVEKNKEEAEVELKASYRNASAAWALVSELQQQMKNMEQTLQSYNDQMVRTGREVEDLRNRQLELLDSDEVLEERIEKLEDAEPLLSPPQEPGQDDLLLDVVHLSPATTTVSKPPSKLLDGLSKAQSSPTECPKSWTVHVSLMPSKDTPFPFEKDTTSYKRCLSRGLHRMLVVEGDDAKSFTDAVSRAFESLLKGRPWVPLQAKLCDAERLQGLPMLRPLELRLAHGPYDRAFLSQHCAVLDASGKMDSLYIAMAHDSLSWNFLKRSPVYLDGLEASWERDSMLDKRDEQGLPTRENHGDEGDESPPAGNIIGALTGFKRSLSEISCSSLDDTETPVPKMARSCKTSQLEMRRGVETAR
ncbi:Ff.00g111170.m01.CDS01 [Fusarium sp. VM40]|nr:Ff.00g111170.m01.CDS01 [Fusarium sp. VM40]